MIHRPMKTVHLSARRRRRPYGQHGVPRRAAVKTGEADKSLQWRNRWRGSPTPSTRRVWGDRKADVDAASSQTPSRDPIILLLDPLPYRLRLLRIRCVLYNRGIDAYIG